MPYHIIWSWYTGHWWVGCYIWYSDKGTGRGRTRSGPCSLFAVPNVTAHPSTASVPITVLLYNGPLLCGLNVGIKGLTVIIACRHFIVPAAQWYRPLRMNIHQNQILAEQSPNLTLTLILTLTLTPAWKGKVKTGNFSADWISFRTRCTCWNRHIANMFAQVPSNTRLQTTVTQFLNE